MKDAACDTDEGRELVDATFSSSGSAAATLKLEARFCKLCPIRTECFLLGMKGEHGAWGGLSKRSRTRYGMPKPPVSVSLMRNGGTEGDS